MRQVTKMPCHLRDAFQSSWFSGRACNSLQRETGSRLTPKYLILPHCPSQPPAFFFFFVLSFLSLFFLSLKSNIGAKFLQKRTGRYGSINRQREFLKIRRRCLDSRDPQLSTCSMCWSPQSSFQSFFFKKDLIIFPLWSVPFFTMIQKDSRVWWRECWIMKEKTWFLFPRISLGCGLTAVTVVLPLVLLLSELGNTLCTYPAGAVNIKWAELPLCDFACRRAWSTHSTMNIHGLTPWIVTATRIEWLIPTLTHAQEGKENDTLSSWDTRAHERKKILKAANTRTPGCIIFQRSHPWEKKVHSYAIK